MTEQVEYRIEEDFDDDGVEVDPYTIEEQEHWQHHALLGLLTQQAGGRLEVDISALAEVVGKPLAIHIDQGAGRAVLEILPAGPKAETYGGTNRRQ